MIKDIIYKSMQKKIKFKSDYRKAFVNFSLKNNKNKIKIHEY